MLADIHGNAVALRAVLDDASRYGVERWWALGDLVVFGPRPAEVLELLIGLPSIEFVMGNTDRHVVEGTAAFSMAGAGARGVAWTQGVLSQAGMLDWLSGLPASQTLELSRGARMLGVHASPSSDDGPGIDPDSSDEQLEELLNGCGAEVVVAGHTHLATDRMVGAIRALNPGSVGLPRRCLGAGWLVVDDKDGLTVEQHVVPFDMDAVISDLRSCRHPNADYVESVLTGRHPNAALSRRSAHLCSWQSTRHNSTRSAHGRPFQSPTSWSHFCGSKAGRHRSRPHAGSYSAPPNQRRPHGRSLTPTRRPPSAPRAPPRSIRNRGQVWRAPRCRSGAPRQKRGS